MLIKPLYCRLLVRLILPPWKWNRDVHSKRRWNLLNSSYNNGIYFSGSYISFQLHARTFTLNVRNLSLSVCLMHLLTLRSRCLLPMRFSQHPVTSPLPLAFNAVSLCRPSVSGCLYIGRKLVSLYNGSSPTFCCSLLASQSSQLCTDSLK